MAERESRRGRRQWAVAVGSKQWIVGQLAVDSWAVSSLQFAVGSGQL